MASKTQRTAKRTKKPTKAPATKRRTQQREPPAPKRMPARGTAPSSRTPASASSPSSGGGGAGSGWTPDIGEVGIRVRMYRVGFGDFFLISFLDAAGKPVHVIVDCGVFKGTKQTGDIHSIEAAVANMAETTGGRVALIIMTHRHADHIAGFARCADTFKKLAVGGVWMPIWESEYEPTALKFQAELTRTAFGLRQHFSSLARASEEQNTARKYMENATGELGATGTAAAGSNAVALNLLKHGFTGLNPGYYKGGDNPQLPKALDGIGVSAQILGPPPVADMDLMKLMDLQKNVGQYLTGAVGTSAGPFEPFDSVWEIDPTKVLAKGQRETYTGVSFREWVYPRKSWQPVKPAQAHRARTNVEELLLQSQPIAALVAAKQLNSFLNNQSLVVLFSFKGKNLLFVGDSQAGNWEHWLFKTDTPDKMAKGVLDATAQQILTNLHFYKVGHHGSGNATPKVVVETMGKPGHKFAAMCSTQKDVYGTEDPEDPTKGTEVPRIPLLQKLASESAFVRSDQIPITLNGKVIPAKVSETLPGAFPGGRFVKGDFWVDCFL